MRRATKVSQGKLSSSTPAQADRRVRWWRHLPLHSVGHGSWSQFFSLDYPLQLQGARIDSCVCILVYIVTCPGSAKNDRRLTT